MCSSDLDHSTKLLKRKFVFLEKVQKIFDQTSYSLTYITVTSESFANWVGAEIMMVEPRASETCFVTLENAWLTTQAVLSNTKGISIVWRVKVSGIHDDQSISPAECSTEKKVSNTKSWFHWLSDAGLREITTNPAVLFLISEDNRPNRAIRSLPSCIQVGTVFLAMNFCGSPVLLAWMDLHRECLSGTRHPCKQSILVDGCTWNNQVVRSAIIR
jgi:hypothetical protein